MRSLLIVPLLLAACTAEAGKAEGIHIGDEIRILHDGTEPIALTGFVLEPGAARPLYYGRLLPGARGLEADHAPPDDQPLRLRFKPADSEPLVLGDTTIAGSAIVTTIGKKEGVEIDLDDTAAEHVWEGGSVTLRVQVVAGKVVLTVE